MQLEQQVVSLDLAKRMKELGFKQESIFYWWKPDNMQAFLDDKDGCHSTDKKETEKMIREYRYSAYTVAELGEMLPQCMIMNDEDYPLVITKLKKEWLVEYLDAGECGGHYWNNEWMAEVVGKTEADSRAKMLIYLKENNLI